MAVPVCTNCSSVNCFINRFANPSWKAKISAEKTTTKTPSKETVFEEGDPVKGIYFIYKGKVKVFNFGFKGKIQIVRFADSGDILGHRGIGDAGVYPISAVALEDSSICFIPSDTFANALKHQPELMFELVNFYARELRRVEYKLRSVGQITVRQRLAVALLTVSEIFGTTKVDDYKFIRVKLSRQEYADITGASLEEIIRTFSLFAKQGLIHLKGKSIAILNKPRLEEMVAEYGELRLP